jgi:hypothetical protein
MMFPNDCFGNCIFEVEVSGIGRSRATSEVSGLRIRTALVLRRVVFLVGGPVAVRGAAYCAMIPIVPSHFSTN